MLAQLLRTKLSAITDERFAPLAHSIEEVLAASSHGGQEWRKTGRDLFLMLVHRLEEEEGIEGATEAPSRLTRYVPNFISAILSDLEALLLGAPETVADPQERPLLTAHLLLKLTEWTVMNYQWECIYGPDADAAASRRLEGLPFGLEIWGDRDEIWTNLIEITESVLPGTSKRLAEPVLGCHSYWARMDLEKEADVTVFFESCPVGAIKPWIEMGIKTMLTDQAVVKVGLMGECGGENISSNGDLEREILTLLGHQCGTPVS